MSVRRIAIAAFVVGMAIVVARVAAPSHASHFRYSTALACGVERWKVKTLQDRPRLLRVHSIPIAQLVSHERPTPLPATRLPFERHIFSVDAAVTLVRHGPDDRGVTLVVVCAWSDALSAPADARGTDEVAALLAGARRRPSPSSISSTDRPASLRTRSSCIRSSTSPAVFSVVLRPSVSPDPPSRMPGRRS